MYKSFTQSLRSRAKQSAARLLFAVSAAASCSALAVPELGVFRGDAPNGPSKLDAFSQWLGRPATVGTAFEPRATWTDIVGAGWNFQPWSQWIKAQPGRTISFAVPMLPTSGASLASCSAGQYDSQWRQLANNLATYGLHSAYLRLGWEMDGTWYAWSAARGSGKEASFAGCFRRIVQVMRQAQPANQWKFVLNTSQTFAGNKAYLDAIWPGDAYVDVVAIDVYDQSWAANTYPYPSTCDATCRSTRQQNAWNSNSPALYAIRDFALAHGKKLAFPEWGVGTRPDGHGGGDNPYFIQTMYEFINNPANNVAYHAYWDYPAADFNAQLSGTTKYPQSAALFKQLFASTPISTNTAPTVSITSPTAGQTVSGPLSYAATASDDKAVTKVEFSVASANPMSLGTKTTPPYSGTLDTTKLENGTHVLTAIAYDAQGVSATSQVSINVQNVNVQNGTAAYTGTTYTGTPIGLPKAFEAENFDKGGEGVAYHDLTSGNSGGRYRTSESVDIIASADSAGGGYVVNNFQTGEWLAYTINVPASGKYDISVRASNNYSLPAAFHIEVDGVNVTGSIAVPKTGSWNTFQWIGKQGIQLAAGKRVLKLVSDAEYFNVNWLSVLASATASSTTPTTTNVALAGAGAVASASSVYSSVYPVSAVNDNQRSGAGWANGGGWNDATRSAFPDWVQIAFNAPKSIDRVVVYTLQDKYSSPVEPTDTMTFSGYGIIDFTVQGWNGSAWVQLASVTGNNLVKRTLNFPTFTTDRIRVQVTRALSSYSRITEIEAWGPTTTNVALASSGAVVSASSAYAGYPISAVIDNLRSGINWGNGGGWNDATPNAFPDWVQINFNGTKSLDRVVVYTLQDNYTNPVEPTDTLTFSRYGLVNFTVQGWNGSAWVTLASVTGNNLIKRTVTFPAFTTDRIRVHITNALNTWSRVTEIEAWGVPDNSGS